ncbi:hypothetical protein Tco_0149380 [Tanacetum coccineum]
MWGMFKRENVDYPELIWRDIAYQIDHRNEKKSRREKYAYSLSDSRKKIIINHFLKQHKSLTNLNYQHYHTIKDDGIETVDVSKESEPEPTKKKTSSKRRVKKKVTLSVDDNIISEDPHAALELAKSISQTEAEEAEKKSGGRSSKSVVIQDTPSAPKSKPATTNTKLKGTGGSNEGTSTIPWFPEEIHNRLCSTEFDKNCISDEEISASELQVMRDARIGMKKMINAEVDDSDKGDEEVTDAAKTDAEKTSEEKDDPMKTELPPTNSSLSVSSGFGDQFFKLSSDSSLVSIFKDTTDIKINSLLDKIQS